MGLKIVINTTKQPKKNSSLYFTQDRFNKLFTQKNPLTGLNFFNKKKFITQKSMLLNILIFFFNNLCY